MAAAVVETVRAGAGAGAEMRVCPGLAGDREADVAEGSTDLTGDRAFLVVRFADQGVQAFRYTLGN